MMQESHSDNRGATSMLSTIKKVQHQIDCITKFLSPLLPIANCHMVEFITDNHWEKLPETLRNVLERWDLNHAVDKFWEGAVNESKETTELNNWINNSRAHCISSNNEYCLSTDQLQQSITSWGGVIQPSIKVTEFMNSKKSYEVSTMSRLVSSLHHATSSTCCIEAGGGRGHLLVALTLGYKIPSITVDCDENKVKAAEKRVQIIQKQWHAISKRIQCNDNLDIRNSDYTSRYNFDTNGNITDTNLNDSDTNQNNSDTNGNLVDSNGNHSNNNQDNSTLNLSSSDANGNLLDTKTIDSDTDKNNSDTNQNASARNRKSSSDANGNLLDTVGNYSDTLYRNNSDKKQTRSDKNQNASDTNQKSRSKLHRFATAYITKETDLAVVVKDQFPEFNGDIKLLLTGLHTCGDLGPSSLQLFTSHKHTSAVFNVPCCYHLLTDGGFPMSHYLKGYKLERNARMLAALSIDRVVHQKQLPAKSLLYRAMLQVLIKKYLPNEKIPEGKLKRLSKCNSFEEYFKMADAVLNLELFDRLPQCCLNEINSDCHWRKLVLFYLLRLCLAQVIESVILLDRILFLYENGIEKAYLVKLFDPILSPRCHGIVAVR